VIRQVILHFFGLRTREEIDEEHRVLKERSDRVRVNVVAAARRLDSFRPKMNDRGSYDKIPTP
jgi:hypothetical protein